MAGVGKPAQSALPSWADPQGPDYVGRREVARRMAAQGQAKPAATASTAAAAPSNVNFTGYSGLPGQAKPKVTAEGRMGEIAAEYEDYKKLSPRDFYNAYRMTKQQWMDKHRDIVSGQVDEQVKLPYEVRSQQLGRANFELLTRFYNKPTSPVLSLNFGKDVVDLEIGRAHV